MKKILIITTIILLIIYIFILITSQTVNPPKAYGWYKYESNPILGNKDTGSLFDPQVIIDQDGKYRMYVSWRKQKTIAVTTSVDRNTLDRIKNSFEK